MAPIARASTSDLVPMKLDAILRAREEDKEEYSKESAKEAEETKALFFMESNHEKIRTNKDPETYDYWEAGITTDTISALKTRNIDRSQ